jgi:hypothetical protein
MSDSRHELPTTTIAKAVLTAILVTKYDGDVEKMPIDYTSFDGTKLPYPSGYSGFNALSTYIDHGGEKTEAIEKFIDTHLRTEEQLMELVEYVVNKLK